LNEDNDNRDGAMVGLVTGIHAKADRNGRMMAFVTLEDFEGSYEAIFFKRPYEDCRAFISEEHVLWMKGRVNSSNGDCKFIVDQAMPIEEFRIKHTKTIRLSFPAELVDQKTVKTLKAIISSHKGSCRLCIQMKTEDDGTILLETGKDFRVKATDEFLRKIHKWDIQKELTFQTE